MILKLAIQKSAIQKSAIQKFVSFNRLARGASSEAGFPMDRTAILNMRLALR